MLKHAMGRAVVDIGNKYLEWGAIGIVCIYWTV
jgi:hypothetical protein